VKFGITPGVLVKTGGGAGGGVEGTAAAGAGVALIDELHPVIEDEVDEAELKIGGGAAAGRGEAGGCKLLEFNAGGGAAAGAEVGTGVLEFNIEEVVAGGGGGASGSGAVEFGVDDVA
jgi:hypothetical protein